MALLLLSSFISPISPCLWETPDIDLNTVSGEGRVVRWCWVNFQCRGVLPFWNRVEQGPTALAVGAGGGCLDIFSLVYHFFFSLSLSLGDGPI